MPPIKEKNQKKSKIAYNICSFFIWIKLKVLTNIYKLLINNNKTLKYDNLNNHGLIVSQLQKRTVGSKAIWFAFNKEISGLFTKASGENYTLGISSGTLEMKDNKVIVLVDQNKQNI